MADVRNDLTRTTLAILFILALIGGSVLDSPAIPAGGALGCDAGYRHLADIAKRADQVVEQPRARRDDHDDVDRACVRGAVLARHRHDRAALRPDHRVGGTSRCMARRHRRPGSTTFSIDGPGAARTWRDIGDDDFPGCYKGKPYAGMVTRWFIDAMGGFGSILVEFLLAAGRRGDYVCAGRNSAAMTRRFGKRLAGNRGEQAVVLAGQAVRGVALGVVVTAFIQSAIGAFGLFVAGYPSRACSVP